MAQTTNSSGQTSPSQGETESEQHNYQLNYVTANRFYVEMESEIKASFNECSGLGVKVNYTSHREGGVNDQRRILLEQAEFTDVTLKRGITDNLTFWEWMKTLLDSSKRPERRNINILLFNQAGETMQCWTLIGAVPVEWKAPAMQADATTVAIEELTIAYEGLKVERQYEDSAQVMLEDRDASGYYS
ncbi:MAG: phage tail protein [Elainellaceae cyanobacterium]